MTRHGRPLAPMTTAQPVAAACATTLPGSALKSATENVVSPPCAAVEGSLCGGGSIISLSNHQVPSRDPWRKTPGLLRPQARAAAGAVIDDVHADVAVVGARDRPQRHPAVVVADPDREVAL